MSQYNTEVNTSTPVVLYYTLHNQSGNSFRRHSLLEVNSSLIDNSILQKATETDSKNHWNGHKVERHI